jgi:hypothetical protein
MESLVSSGTTILSVVADGDNFIVLTAAGFVIPCSGNAPLGLTNPAPDNLVVNIAAHDYYFFAETQQGNIYRWSPYDPIETTYYTSIQSATTTILLTNDYGSSVLIGTGDVGMWGIWNQFTIVTTHAVEILKTNSFFVALKTDNTVLSWAANTIDYSRFCDGREGNIQSRPWYTFSPNCQYQTPVELTVPSKDKYVVQIATTRYAALALDNQGTLTTWGENPPAIPYDAVDVIAIAGIREYFFALRADNILVKWGHWIATEELFFVPSGYQLSSILPSFALLAKENTTLAGRVTAFRSGQSIASIPHGVTSIRVHMWGAGGSSAGGSGGNGAYVEGILDVAPGQELQVIVGGRGQPNGVSVGGGAMGGGGRSAIQVNGEDMVTAGGGGGGTGGVSASAYDDMFHSGEVSYANVMYLNQRTCFGGTATATKQGASCCSEFAIESKYQGGRCARGSGGGGGYFGGGGGSYRGGGGAGSSYLHHLRESDQSDHASERPGMCAGMHSKYFGLCDSTCGAGSTHRLESMDGCVVIELLGDAFEDPTSKLYEMNRCGLVYATHETTSVDRAGLLSSFRRSMGRG